MFSQNYSKKTRGKYSPTIVIKKTAACNPILMPSDLVYDYPINNFKTASGEEPSQGNHIKRILLKICSEMYALLSAQLAPLPRLNSFTSAYLGPDLDSFNDVRCTIDNLYGRSQQPPPPLPRSSLHPHKQTSL